jgi:dephospho-CoA kinase
VLTVGLTGGIGCGKSTVAELLVRRGAVLIDADAIAREVVEPGASAYQAVVDRFGPGVVASDGSIDRPALAAVVFANTDALADLNAIVHPAVGVVMAERRAAHEGTDHVVLLDIPLLRPSHRADLSLDAVVVVDCPRDVALERLERQRGMPRADAEARMASQATREERRAGADLVVDNGGDRHRLEAEVDRLWEELSRRAVLKGAGGT